MILNSIADKIVFKVLEGIKYGRINLINYDGSKLFFGSENEKLIANIKINKPGFMRNVVNKGSVGLAEAYMRDDFEIDNLSNLIEITAKNIKIVHKFSGIFDLQFVNLIKNFFIKNTKIKSKENISKHYDLGNDFFSLWLDNTLTYSSAIFDNQKNNLEDAQ